MPINLSIPVRVSQPPRAVPRSTRLVVLFGGGFSLFGWLFFAFGMVFVWGFAAKGDFSSFLLLRGKLDTAPGMVTAVDDTRYSEGGSKHRSGTTIFSYQYSFVLDDRKYDGVSYHTGVSVQDGARVTVEFPPGNPARSRIRGMRRAIFGPGVAMVFIFPAIGLGIVLPGLWQGWRNVRLLARGETAQATLIVKTSTNMSVNRRMVYKLTFQFTDRDGQFQHAIARTSLPERLESQSQELVFYDPVSKKNTLLDDLPGNQALTEQGDLQPCGFRAALGAALPPLVALLSVLAGLVLKFLG